MFTAVPADVIRGNGYQSFYCCGRAGDKDKSRVILSEAKNLRLFLSEILRRKLLRMTELNLQFVGDGVLDIP